MHLLSCLITVLHTAAQMMKTHMETEQLLRLQMTGLTLSDRRILASLGMQTLLNWHLKGGPYMGLDLWTQRGQRNTARPHWLDESGGRTCATCMQQGRLQRQRWCSQIFPVYYGSMWVLFIVLPQEQINKYNWPNLLVREKAFTSANQRKSSETLPAGKQQVRGRAHGRTFVCSFPHSVSNCVLNIGIICGCSGWMWYSGSEQIMEWNE